MFEQVNIKEFCVVHFFFSCHFLWESGIYYIKRQEQDEFIFYCLFFYEFSKFVWDRNQPLGENVLSSETNVFENFSFLVLITSWTKYFPNLKFFFYFLLRFKFHLTISKVEYMTFCARITFHLINNIAYRHLFCIYTSCFRALVLYNLILMENISHHQ